MNRITQLGLLFFLATSSGSSVAGETNDYRLAGTVDSGVRGWLAVLELPGGEQRLLKQGDAIPGGEILDIGDEWIKLSDWDGEQTLRLEGDVSYVVTDEPMPMLITLEASASLRETLNQLDGSKNKEQKLAADISKLLQIPEEGQIASINDRPASSVKHGLQLLKQSLVANHPVRIEVSGVEGFDAVYLMPAQPPNNKN